VQKTLQQIECSYDTHPQGEPCNHDKFHTWLLFGKT